MNYEELLNYLDLEEPSEFQYFEVIADLVECENEIEQEAVFGLFSGADTETVCGLIDDYFEDVENGLPDDSDDVFSLLEQIRLCLGGLLANASDESDMRMFTDEFCRFREWYSFDDSVELISDETGASDRVCLRDAVTSARIEKLGGEKFSYSFNDSLNYELDSYTMSFAELAAIEDE